MKRSSQSSGDLVLNWNEVS